MQIVSNGEKYQFVVCCIIAKRVVKVKLHCDTQETFFQISFSVIHLTHQHNMGKFCRPQTEDIFLNCLCWGFMAQSTQWGHVERGQFTLPHFY